MGPVNPKPTAAAERAFVVLHVEDDEELAASVAGLLSAAGIDSMIAVDGASALAQVAHRRAAPDVLIMDVNLPGEMDGADVAQEVCHAIGHVVPTIFLSGQLSNVGLPWLPGAPLLFVAKPLDADVLIEVVESFARLGRFMRAHLGH